jgi:hypothetical protein
MDSDEQMSEHEQGKSVVQMPVVQLIDRSIDAERRWINTEFKQRDEAIVRLREEKKDTTTTYIALAAAITGCLGLILAAVGLVLQMKGH